MPGIQGFLKAAVKPIRWVVKKIRRKKQNYEDTNFPEPQITYVDEPEANPETLADARRGSIPSLTDCDEAKEEPLEATEKENDGEEDLDTDSSPGQAEFNPMSDSLEDILDMVEEDSTLMDGSDVKEGPSGAKEKEIDEEMSTSFNSWDVNSNGCPPKDESNPGVRSDSLDDISDMPEVASLGSMMDGSDVKEGTEKETDEEMNTSFNSWDVNSNACPPKDDRIPQPQRASSSDSEGSFLGYDVYKLGCLPTSKDLHGLCKKFSHYSWPAKLCTADTLARRHLGPMLDHFLRSSETVCDELMYAVLESPDCDRARCMDQLMHQANAGSMVEDSEEQHLAKVKAVRAIGAVVRHISDLQTLTTAFPFYLTTLTNILVSQSQPLKAGTGSQFKKYVAPGEVIDILGVLLQRMNLVQQLKNKVCPG